jgi:triphosphoribosyl-dephospho-CoA synthase
MRPPDRAADREAAPMIPRDMPARTAFAKHCFLRACALDVAVRKPGNVSVHSPGHGMDAALFVASAQAAVEPLFEAGARVGARIEAAVAASWRAAGCNTNLGILLLCAPIAHAIEQPGALAGAPSLRDALQAVLSSLDLEDARRAYRAIAMAKPAGLGQVPQEDVHSEPQLPLRAAMALAAARDSIAGEYLNGFARLFEIAPVHRGFSLMSPNPDAAPSIECIACVQQVYLRFLSEFPDSHIVRKHGIAVAHTVMSAAQAWREHPAPHTDPAFAAWDQSLKAQRLNPGTSADLTVAALLIALLLGAGPGAGTRAWHGK